MNRRHIFSLLICLSACQAKPHYPLRSDVSQDYSFEPIEEPVHVPPTTTGRVPLNSQEISFSQPHNRHVLSLNAQGNGLLVSGAAESSEPLSIHAITQFALQKETSYTYPDLVGVPAAAYKVFMNEAGQGQVIVVNTASSIPPFAVAPAVSRGADNSPLEIRTLAISDFKPAEKPELITVPGRFSRITPGQVLVNEEGNGFMSLQVIDAPEASSPSPVSRWIFLPIRSHRVESTPVKTLDISGVSGEIDGVWLNAEEDGFVLYRQAPHRWFVRSIYRGKVSDQAITLGDALTGSRPKVEVDAAGMGSIHFIQTDRLQQLRWLDGFSIAQPQILPLPPLPENYSLVSSFKGKRGSVVEIPSMPNQDNTWTLKSYHLDQGELQHSRQFTYAMDPIRILGGGTTLNLTPHGDGLFAWSTLQKGGMNGTIHLMSFEGFQFVDSEHSP